MRIPKEQCDFLKETIKNLLPEADIYLFGSRTDPLKKGGDIDILVIAEKILDLKEVTLVKTSFCKQFGDQKIDIVSYKQNDENTFKKLALSEGIKL